MRHRGISRTLLFLEHRRNKCIINITKQSFLPGGKRKKGSIPYERRQAWIRNSACAPTSANTALTGREEEKLQEGKNPASTPTSLNTEFCMHADKREHSPEAKTTSRKHTRFYTTKRRQNIRFRNNASQICIRQIVCEIECWVGVVTPRRNKCIINITRQSFVPGGKRKKGPTSYERRQAWIRNSACAPTSANTALTGREEEKLQEGKNPASTPTSLNTEFCMHADKREHSPEAKTTSRKHTRFYTTKRRQNIRFRNNASQICIRQIVCEIECWVGVFCLTTGIIY